MGRLAAVLFLRLSRACAPAALALVLAATAGAAGPWRQHAALPLPRSEVAAALVGEEIAIAGGYLAAGGTSARVDAYSPARNRWRRLPSLPLAVNHAQAAAWRGRLYVAGGYDGAGQARRDAFVLDRGRWRRLPPLPEARAAGGAAVAGDRLYVVGGVALQPVGGRTLAREAFSLDLRSERWSALPGPTPREHLGVASLAGRVYAVGGRLAGLDTNLDLVEELAPGRGWRRLPPVPGRRGGTGLAALPGLLVSAGGEEQGGTIEEVYALHLGRRSWRRLADLPSPRHGLGLTGFRGRVYAIAGGAEPGLFVSGTNESLAPG